MSLRHAAALAIVVWYLTYPPFKKNQYGHDRADPTVPLTEWNFYPKYSEPDEKLEVDEEEFFDRAHALEFRTADEWNAANTKTIPIFTVSRSQNRFLKNTK